MNANDLLGGPIQTPFTRLVDEIHDAVLSGKVGQVTCLNTGYVEVTVRGVTLWVRPAEQGVVIHRGEQRAVVKDEELQQLVQDAINNEFAKQVGVE